MYKNHLTCEYKNKIIESFNPCFNGSMYKNKPEIGILEPFQGCFNPCFNGSMYKNPSSVYTHWRVIVVSILVLMDLCIKTTQKYLARNQNKGFNPCFNGSMYKNSLPMIPFSLRILSFNPCFNGSMYKNKSPSLSHFKMASVSILVLMDLCIKTIYMKIHS